jgi:cytochrome b subunit of formate dehydrogenase
VGVMQRVKIRFDFIIHWLWTVVFVLLLISGLSLMGAKFGWITNYNLALSDYIHRTLAVPFVILGFAAIVMEAYRISTAAKPMQWLIVKKTGIGIYNLAVILLFAISGLFLWLCTEFSPTILAFAFTIHELLTFISVIVLIWHIYTKAHGLPRDIGEKNNVSKNVV